MWPFLLPGAAVVGVIVLLLGGSLGSMPASGGVGAAGSAGVASAGALTPAMSGAPSSPATPPVRLPVAAAPDAPVAATSATAASLRGASIVANVASPAPAPVPSVVAAAAAPALPASSPAPANLPPAPPSPADLLDTRAAAPAPAQPPYAVAAQAASSPVVEVAPVAGALTSCDAVLRWALGGAGCHPGFACRPAGSSAASAGPGGAARCSVILRCEQADPGRTGGDGCACPRSGRDTGWVRLRRDPSSALAGLATCQERRARGLGARRPALRCTRSARMRLLLTGWRAGSRLTG